MTLLEHSLERTIVICAPRAVVFHYFTDSERFASWWGAGSRIEARPGGGVFIRYPNGVTASGRVVELAEGESIVFTYGYDSGRPIPPGSSRVTIHLEDHPRGTRLKLRHEFADSTVRDDHVAGWRYQLALFANVAGNEAQASLADMADRWFAAWRENDAAAREALLRACVTETVMFQDAYGCTSGLEDLDAHIAAAQVHMPGVAIRRDGIPRHCQGTALIDWVVTGADGAPRGRGTSIFTLTPDGRIAGVVGL
jgi:uncharacterized protein YndB with AHSA1/START domain